MATILVVDDQTNMRRSIAIALQHEGYVVHEAAGAAAALDMLRSNEIDVIVTDVRLGGQQDGAGLLRAAKGLDAQIEVVLVTAFGTIDAAVDAMKAGAYDYLTKPFDPDRLLIAVKRAAERCSLAREVKQLRAQMGSDDTIIAESRMMRAVLQTVAQVARNDSTVVITGESGTGKELVARALHQQSRRQSGKFVPVNCGALPESILESELFGHRKGAFTGAVSDRKGLLEEASGGVLFLDEVGEMSTSMQVQLLRFLEGGEVRRIGDTTTRCVDVRVVLATNRRLEDAVAAGEFRQDFFYRINVVGIHIPPLRERPEDILPLARHFLGRLAARLGSRVTAFSPDATALLTQYRWPGNARELQNAIERALNLASGDAITESDLPAAITVTVSVPQQRLRENETLERERLVAALQHARWNQSRAAADLGMSRTTLWRKLREYQIET
jgi:DNA-binding NtrC family response regulator